MSSKFKLNWENYFIRRGGECKKFWKMYLEQRTETNNILFILGIGFDPRIDMGLKTIIDAGAENISCLAIRIDEGPDSPTKEYTELVEENYKKIEELVGSKNIRDKLIKMFDKYKRRIGPRELVGLLRGENLTGYPDLIIDVSALPRCIFFTMITELLKSLSNSDNLKNKNKNLHVLVAENPELDKKIKQDVPDEEPYSLPGFGKDISRTSTENIPKVWIPILGEGKNYHLKRIYESIKPEEVCPMLPFPAKNPRRCDDLIKEYYEFLFDGIQVEPKNFIYAAEDNPFDVYRQIVYTAIRYNNSLKSLGGCITVISPLSSKIMTIGAAIGAYELRKNALQVGVLHLDALGYSITDDIGNLKKIAKKSELFSIWLSGDCYG